LLAVPLFSRAVRSKVSCFLQFSGCTLLCEDLPKAPCLNTLFLADVTVSVSGMLQTWHN
jgi:hypothetical protein